MKNFLKETDLIDFSNSEIKKLAITLAINTSSEVEVAKNCFTFVRDKINHSDDVVDDTITTYKAADVLKYKTGWYRVDARGNKKGVHAEFNPPNEKLAFELEENEYDLPEILEDPLPEVIEALKTYKCYDEIIHHFPDIK